MTIKFPFGGEIRAHGRSVILTIICFALIAVLIWHDFKTTQQNTAVVESLQAVAFVLTLSERERKQLNLVMPESLRHKLEKESRNDPPR